MIINKNKFGVVAAALACVIVSLASGREASSLDLNLNRTGMLDPVTSDPLPGQREAPLPAPSLDRPTAGGSLDGASLAEEGTTEGSSGSQYSGLTAISNAERLTIKFRSFEQLSGEYRIGADDTVSIPALGRVSVGSLTGAELEHELADLVVKLTGRETDVTVEVAEYRPVFVTGYVKAAGSYPWKPGMTVLHAETLSGGIYRPGEGNNGFSENNATTRVRKAQSDLKRVLASIARLTAEQQDTDTVEIPPRLVELAGPDEAGELIAAQNSSLVARRSAVQSQLESFERGTAMAKQELEGLIAQRGRINEQLSLRRTVLTHIEELLAKGLVRFDRKLEEQSKIADLEEKSANIGVAIARVEGTLVTMQRDTVNVKQERRSQIDAEIFKLEREQAQLEIDIDAARTANQLQVASTATQRSAEGAITITYGIVRRENREVQTIVADRFTPVRPGDIVVVSVAGAPTAVKRSELMIR